MPKSLVEHRRQQREARAKKQAKKVQSVNTWMYSIGGQLISIYDDVPSSTPEHSQKYNPIQLGEPLVIRYKKFFINEPTSANKKEEIMLSTFLTSSESANPATETVNFYDDKMQFDSEGKKYFDPARADNYGNQLIYYTKSYLGEPILMTTSVMELDNQNYTDILNKALSTASTLPFFIEYLPHIVVAQTISDWLGKLWNFLDKDDEIMGRMSLNLYYERDFSEKLRHGRYVCVKGLEESDLLGFKLKTDNTLLDPSGQPYEGSSYFVTQVDSKYEEEYENFQNAQASAELLALTNRKEGSDLQGFLNVSIEAASAYSDIETLNKMEKIQNRLSQTGMLDKYKAYYNNLSSETQERYSIHYNSKIEA